jgi:Spore Coat Protein U domain
MKYGQRILPVFSVIAITMLFSQVAKAQDSSNAQFSVTGTAPKVCALTSPVATSLANNAAFASNTLTITQFINPNTAHVNASSLSLQFPNSLCNYNAKFSLQSQNGGLTSATASAISGGSRAFLQNVPYTVFANWGSLNLLLDTSLSNGSAMTASYNTNGAISGNLTLTIATAISTLPVPQGTYQDTLTLKIGAPM